MSFPDFFNNSEIMKGSILYCGKVLLSESVHEFVIIGPNAQNSVMLPTEYRRKKNSHDIEDQDELAFSKEFLNGRDKSVSLTKNITKRTLTTFSNKRVTNNCLDIIFQ